MVALWTLHRVGCHRLRCRVMCKVMCGRGTTAGIPSASLLALPRQFLLLKTWLPLHGSVLVAEVQGQSLRVAACDGETALSNTVSLLMFAETSACLVRSLIRALVCALVSPSRAGSAVQVMEGRYTLSYAHTFLPPAAVCGLLPSFPLILMCLSFLATCQHSSFGSHESLSPCGCLASAVCPVSP